MEEEKPNGNAARSLNSHALSVTIIRPPQGKIQLGLSELWAYRGLLKLFVWRDYRVRYKQTLVGVIWALLQPLLTMIILSVFLGVLVQVPGKNVSYSIYTFSALILWTYFVNVLTQCSNGVILHHSIITRVYFPKLVIPFSISVTSLVDLAITFLVLICMVFLSGISLGWPVFTIPFFIFMLIVSALGPGLWLAALNAQFRDVGFALPFLTQIWFFATPVAYPSTLIPERWHWAYALNPMAGVIEGFRWALLGTPLSPVLWMVSCVSASVMFLSGIYFFRYKEGIFADIV